MSGDRRQGGLWIMLRFPGRTPGTMVGLCRGIDHLLVAEQRCACRYRHTGGMNRRMVGRNAEYPLTHISRVTQNRTGGHLAGKTTDCTSVMWEVQGDRSGRLIVIGCRKVFLFLDGHELAFDLALCASFTSLASGVGRSTLKETIANVKRGRWMLSAIDGREKAHFDLAATTLGAGHKGPAAATPG